MMIEETVKEFLQIEKAECAYLNSLVNKYSLGDFVKVDKDIKNNISDKSDRIGNISGCLYNCREDYFCTNIDIVEDRLRREYFDFLLYIIFADDKIDKKLYILAFHYLAYCKQMGYLLTVPNDAPFPTLGNEMNPRAKRNLEKYKDVQSEEFYSMMPYISEEDIYHYNRIFYQYRYNSLSTKHFSFLEYVLQCEKIVGHFEMNRGFENVLDLFIFRYKAVFTVKDLGLYMFNNSKEKITESLVSL